MLRLALAAVLICNASTATSAEIFGPSFLCYYATVPAEKKICADPKLAEADADIAAAYRALFSKLDRPGIDALAKDQQTFIAARNDIALGDATSYSSLDVALAERLKFLQSIDPEPADGFVGTWKNAYGVVEVTGAEGGVLTANVQSVDPNRGNWVCNADGSGQVAGGVLDIKVEGDLTRGKIVLAREGRLLDVKVPGQEVSAQYCGLNGTLEGLYFKVTDQ